MLPSFTAILSSTTINYYKPDNFAAVTSATVVLEFESLVAVWLIKELCSIAPNRVNILGGGGGGGEAREGK